MDIGIYAINGARYMIGEDPVWVTAQETKTDPVKFKEGVDETIMFQLGFPGGAVASCLSTYQMNNLDKFFLNGEKGFAEMQRVYGALPWQRVVAPGEAYAATGFPISQALSVRLADAQNVVRLDAGLAAEFLDESGQPRAAGSEAIREQVNADSLVFYMGRDSAPEIARQLIKAGRAGVTPVAIVEACSTTRERTLTLTLAALAAGEAQAWLDPAQPSLLMIGDAFAERTGQAQRDDEEQDDRHRRRAVA